MQDLTQALRNFADFGRCNSFLTQVFLVGSLVTVQLGMKPSVAAEVSWSNRYYGDCGGFCDSRLGNDQGEPIRLVTPSGSWLIAQPNDVDLAIQQYLLTTNGGPVGNRNYWKNANYPGAVAYIDFFNYFILRFGSEVIPINAHSYRTELPDGTVVIVRPTAFTIKAPTVEIQRPTGIPIKVRYLPPGQRL